MAATGKVGKASERSHGNGPPGRGAKPATGDDRRPPVLLPEFRSELLTEYAKTNVGPAGLRDMGRALDVLARTPGVSNTADLAAPDLSDRFLAAGGWTKPASRAFYERRLRAIRRLSVSLGHCRDADYEGIVTFDGYDAYHNDHILTFKQVNKLILFIRSLSGTWSKHRLYAITRAMLYTGMHVSEILGIMVKDIDLPGRSIMVIDRRDMIRRRITRRFEIAEPLAEDLAEWLPRVGSEWAFPCSDWARSRLVMVDRPPSFKAIHNDLHSAVRAARVPGFTFRSLRKFHLRHGPDGIPDFGPRPPLPAPGRAGEIAGIVLRGPNHPPSVRGVEKPRLDPVDYQIVRGLLAAGRAGLSKADLEYIVRNSDARKRMRRLAKSDPDGWGKAYRPAGTAWRTYRMGFYDDCPNPNGPHLTAGAAQRPTPTPVKPIAGSQ